MFVSGANQLNGITIKGDRRRNTKNELIVSLNEVGLDVNYDRTEGVACNMASNSQRVSVVVVIDSNSAVIKRCYGGKEIVELI